MSEPVVAVERPARGRRLQGRGMDVVLGLGVVLLLGATLVGFVSIQGSRDAALLDHLQEDAEGTTTALARLTFGARTAPAAIAGLAAAIAPSDLTPETFDEFTSPLRDIESMGALEWIDRVPAADAAAFTQRMRTRVPAFTIYEPGADGQKIPAAGRDAYYPVTLIEPMEGNAAALGVDDGAEPTRAAALEAARDTGTAVASAPLDLVQGGVGMLVFYPAYAGGTDPGTVEARRRALIGFGLAVVRPSALLDRAVTVSRVSDLGVALYDLGPAAGPVATTGRLLAARPDPRTGTPAPTSWEGSFDMPVARTTFDAAGRHFGLVAAPGAGYATGQAFPMEWLLLAAGLGGALLLVAYGLQRRRNERDLQASAARLHSVVEASPDAFMGLDANGRVTDWSAQAARMFGVEREAAMGRPIGSFVEMDAAAGGTDSAGDVSPLASPATDPADPAAGDRREGLARRSDGTAFPVEVTMAAGLPRSEWAVACFIRDATETARAREERIRASRAEAIGDLTGRVAHDFNNLLGIILGSLELLRDHVAGDAEAEEYIGDAHVAAERGVEITHALLAAARRRPSAAQDHDVVGLIREILPLVRRAVSPGVGVEADLPSEPVVAHLDASAFATAILNLATNANAAMPDGGHLMLRVERGRMPEPDAVGRGRALGAQGVLPGAAAVVVSVIDDGLGMTAHVLARAFDPLFTTKAAGTGLGLAIVDDFARRSGGLATIDSQPGDGTTVRLYLVPSAAPAQDGSAGGDEVPVPIPEVGPMRIVLAEDEEALRDILVRRFRELGLQVDTASTAPEAFARIEEVPPDLLVSDVLMPGEYGGIELARRVRARMPGLPIILVSGYFDESLEVQIPEGVITLQKPVRTADLMSALASARDGLADASRDGAAMAATSDARAAG